MLMTCYGLGHHLPVPVLTVAVLRWEQYAFVRDAIQFDGDYELLVPSAGVTFSSDFKGSSPVHSVGAVDLGCVAAGLTRRGGEARGGRARGAALGGGRRGRPARFTLAAAGDRIRTLAKVQGLSLRF